jgi:hypothetical protein
MSRLCAVSADEGLAGLVAKALAVHAGQGVEVGVEADVLHDAAHDAVVVDLGLGRALARDDDQVVLGHGLARDLALRVDSPAGIQHGVADLVLPTNGSVRALRVAADEGLAGLVAEAFAVHTGQGLDVGVEDASRRRPTY